MARDIPAESLIRALGIKAGAMLAEQQVTYLRLLSGPPPPPPGPETGYSRGGQPGHVVVKGEVLQGRTVCGDVPMESDCRCLLEPHGPEVNHVCTENGCRAIWNYDGLGAFVPVRTPVPLSMLMGFWPEDDDDEMREIE